MVVVAWPRHEKPSEKKKKKILVLKTGDFKVQPVS
jgi:hypothetical protein